MKSFNEFNESLWDNIHKKRKSGKPMRKPGSKGAPTKQDFERSRSEDVDEAKLSDIKKKLSKIKGLKTDQLQVLQSLPMPVITSIVNQLSMIVSNTELEEAPLVMSHADILDTIWKKLKPDLEKELQKGKVETVNNLARMVRYKVTTKGQQKGRAYRYDLKR